MAQATHEDRQRVTETIGSWMDHNSVRERIGEALAGYFDPETFIAQCVLTAREELAECSAQSLFEAFLTCAQLGLLPGRHHGHVALIPRAGRVDVMPQWQGYKFLMEQQPNVAFVEVTLVHVLDEFRLVDGVPKHDFDPFDPDRVFLHPSDLGADEPHGLRGGYLTVTYRDGTKRWHFVHASKIEASRLSSDIPDLTRNGNKGVWRLWYEQQASKSVLRDAWARRAVPVDPLAARRLARTIEADHDALGSDPSKRSELPSERPPLALTHQPVESASRIESRGEQIRERVRAARAPQPTPPQSKPQLKSQPKSKPPQQQQKAGDVEQRLAQLGVEDEKAWQSFLDDVRAGEVAEQLPDFLQRGIVDGHDPLDLDDRTWQQHLAALRVVVDAWFGAGIEGEVSP